MFLRIICSFRLIYSSFLVRSGDYARVLYVRMYVTNVAVLKDDFQKSLRTRMFPFF